MSSTGPFLGPGRNSELTPRLRGKPSARETGILAIGRSSNPPGAELAIKTSRARHSPVDALAEDKFSASSKSKKIKEHKQLVS
jgi:hypothetical protein